MFTRHRVPMVYSRAEVLSDAAVHAVGLVSALIAAPVLVTLAAVWFGDPTTIAAAAIYGLSLIAMFLCSAVYNHLALPARKDVLRRLDQSAIYVKIAGSYTPFAVLTGTHAGFFLAGVWGTAVLGASLIVAAGSIYTAGLFFFLWERLPFHNTIWHLFVLAASFVLYAAVLLELSGRAPGA